jgi:hypothetical protein
VGGIDWSIAKDLGIGGIGLVVLLMVALGRLMPRRTVNSMLAGKDEAIAFWKHAAEQREQALAETIPLLRVANENHETLVRLVAGLQVAVEERSRRVIE